MSPPAGAVLPVGVTAALLLRDNSSIPGLVAPGLIIALVGGVVGAAVAALSLRIARKTLFSPEIRSDIDAYGSVHIVRADSTQR